jgi:hypothetical protein
MPIEIQTLRVLEGPNIHYPQAGVAAQLSASSDIREALGFSIKTWAQAVGLIIGYLRIKASQQADGIQLEVSYTCNHPALGGDILRHAVADLLAAERRDEEWDHDDALFEVRRRRMREDPALPLLQLRASAQGHGLPTLAVGDGTLQIGSGAAAWRFDPAGLSMGLSIEPPWGEIGLVPLVAVGGAGAAQVAVAVASALQAAGHANVVLVADGTFEAIRTALLDQSAAMIVAALNIESALARGLPFNRCAVGVVLALDELEREAALAAGLPALVADEAGATLLRADDQRSAALQQRTAAPVVLLQPAVAPVVPPNTLIATVVAVVQSLLDSQAI